MASFSKTPTYNLKVIVQETGIKPDTLRAWERRYGLPAPDRTNGGHRLYSEYDIEMVKWFIARQDEGLSISRAVKLWQGYEKQEKDPLTELEYESESESTFAAPETMPTGATVADMRAAWIKACMEFNEIGAEQVVTQAFAIYPAEMVCIEILQKGVAEIGRMWYANQTTVQQEHFASALAMRRLNTLLAAAPSPTRAGRILIGCPPEENHTFAPLLLTLLLRYQGWEVVYLGANVPLDRLKVTVEKVKPHLIILTAQQLHTAATLAQAFQLLLSTNTPLAFGGRIFNYHDTLPHFIPGHFLGTTLPDAVRTSKNILTEKPTPPPITTVSEAYRIALATFKEKQASLENRIWELLSNSNIPYAQTTVANSHLSRDIIAALTLGDLSLLGSEIVWIEMLMANYDMPSQVLRQYLEAYHQAASELLNSKGAPIVNWLENALYQEEVVSAAA